MRIRATDLLYPVGTLLKVKEGRYGYEGSLFLGTARDNNLVFKVVQVLQTWGGYKRTVLQVVGGTPNYHGRTYYDITNTGLQRSFELAEFEVRVIKGGV